MVTIKEVARLAGVSTATVSRTLAAPDKVAKVTRERVMRAVRDSGYVPNTLGRNFRQRRSNLVLVLVPDISNPFFSSIIRGIERVAGEQGYRILLGDTQYNASRQRDYSELVTQRQADGIICLGMDIPFSYRKGRKSIDPAWPPFVMACEYDGQIPVPTVCIDNEAAALAAVGELIALGHRNIAFINGPEASPICRDRLAGYRRALTEAGITPRQPWWRHGDFSLASGHREMRRLLAQKQRPSAVFCANDEMAMGAMRAAREAGLDLPGELSVMGFDDIDVAAYAWPSLSTVRQPRDAIGVQAMRLMLDLLQGRTAPQERVILPHEIVLRESTVSVQR